MFENIMKFFKKLIKSDNQEKTKDTAKERLHLVLMQDRANVSAEFLALMKQEIIEVIKKYVDVDENQIDVKLTNEEKDDGTTGAPVLYANIPIAGIKENVTRTVSKEDDKNQEKEEEPTPEKIEEVKDTESKPEETEEIQEETKDENKENNENLEEQNKEEISKEDSVEKIKEDTEDRDEKTEKKEENNEE